MTTMGSPWNALHRSLVTSTIWREPDHVRLVWITLLALADRLGVVEGSVPGLADMARVSIDDCEDALKRLSSPDKWSRTQEFEGRRIETVDGGWMLLNFSKHRAETNHEKRKEYKREWMREYRRRQKVSTGQSTGTRGMHEDTPEPEPLPDPDPDPDLPDQLTPKDGKSFSKKPSCSPSWRKKPNRCALPATWAPTAEHKARAAKLGVPLQAEVEKFRLHAEQTGRLMVSWNAAFTTWLIHAAEYRRSSNGRSAPSEGLSERDQDLADHTRERLLRGEYGPRGREFGQSATAHQVVDWIRKRRGENKASLNG